MTPFGSVEFCSQTPVKINPALAKATKSTIRLSATKARGYIPVFIYRPFSCWQWSIPAVHLVNDDCNPDFLFAHDEKTTEGILTMLTNLPEQTLIKGVTVWFLWTGK